MKTRTIWALAAMSVALFALCAAPAFATGCGTGGLTTWDAQAGICRPVSVPTTPAQPAAISNSSNSSSTAEAGAVAGAGAQAQGGAGSSTIIGGDSRLYVMPAPVAATPLPAGLCQRSSSRAFALGWNLVSAARSDSETDVACLERAFAAMPRPQPPMVLSDPRSLATVPDTQALALQPAQALAAPAARKAKGHGRAKRGAQAADTPAHRVIPTCAKGEVLACAKLMEVW